ncbi:MAG: S8 family serine peptidase, partial [Thermoplasmatota archaeon]
GVSLLGGAPHVSLLVARVCYQDAPQHATCNGSVLPAAVDWAVAQGARVISMSLGDTRGQDIFTNLNPDALQSSIQNATAKGVVVIAAAGNTCSPSEAHCTNCQDVEFPASIPSVVAVAAVDESGAVASFSCRGDDSGHPCIHIPQVDAVTGGRCDPDRKPEIAAPGVNILSSWTSGQYMLASGTSMATPFVTSAVALLLASRHGQLTSLQDVEALKVVLEGTAGPAVGAVAGHDPGAGYGILKAQNALASYPAD